ncbi:MAG: CBS domain-containing protein [Bacteroidota bacterium]
MEWYEDPTSAQSAQRVERLLQVAPDTYLTDAVSLMRVSMVRRLLVVSHNRTLGVLSRRDIDRFWAAAPDWREARVEDVLRMQDQRGPQAARIYGAPAPARPRWQQPLSEPVPAQTYTPSAKQVMDDLSQNIRHQMNNLMNPIFIGIELLSETVPNADDVDLLETMETSAYQLFVEVQRLLEEGQQRMGSPSIPPSPQRAS